VVSASDDQNRIFVPFANFFIIGHKKKFVIFMSIEILKERINASHAFYVEIIH